MNWFYELITNPFLLTALSSWAIAQVLKVFINAAVNQTWDLERLFGDGGMPSGHSATVASLAVFTALRCGTGSFQFAMAAIFAIIVCHDAMGVRLETGKQAALLNDLVEAFNILSTEDLPEVKLKELVGHTPTQVSAGVIIGILNALMMHYWIL
ncbi:MAG: divergent PAP2 family protein [Oscillibacter sp.]|jgi:acid phosphatase family membrane protein YuiD|nr:divergent PAP2 family protein [Oscillibacter sp.]